MLPDATREVEESCHSKAAPKGRRAEGVSEGLTEQIRIKWLKNGDTFAMLVNIRMLMFVYFQMLFCKYSFSWSFSSNVHDDCEEIAMNHRTAGCANRSMQGRAFTVRVLCTNPFITLSILSTEECCQMKESGPFTKKVAEWETKFSLRRSFLLSDVYLGRFKGTQLLPTRFTIHFLRYHLDVFFYIDASSYNKLTLSDT